MLESIRVALLTYSERTAFYVFGLVATALTLIETLAVRGGSAVSILSYFAFAIPLVVGFSALVGSQLSRQFIPSRKQLMPGFASAHFGAALAATLLLVIVLALPVVLSARLGFDGFSDWPLVSIPAVVAALWFVGLLAASTAYFGGPTAAFAVWLPALFAGSVQARRFAFMILSDHHRGVPAVLLIDLIATTVLMWRIAHVNEDAREYQWRVQQNQRANKRRWWPGSAGIKRLDRIPRPLKRNLWAQLRHFQLGFAIPTGFLQSEVMFVVILWAINAWSGTSPQTPYILIFLAMPVITVVSAIKNRKNGFQLEFMLPFHRTEIVARLTGALFLSMLRTWLGYAASTYFVAWMPLPGKIQGIPSVLPWLVSFAAQFPLFGLAMLGLLLWRMKPIYVPAIGVTFLVVFTATLATGFGSNSQVALVVTGLVVLGISSIWYSYRRWCLVDL